MMSKNCNTAVVYRYYGFDKFQCFTPDRAKSFRSCPGDVGAVRSVHVGWANAIFVTGGFMHEVRLDDIRMTSVPTKHRVREVSCGHGHQLALTANGELLSWGNGGHGELGHGSLESVQSPRLIEPLAGVVLAGAAAGGWHSAALSDAGDLYLWGWNLDGQLATEPMEKPLSALPLLFDMDVCAVSLGSRHTAAVAANSSAWAWGSNAYGQLGPGSDEITQSAKPVQLVAEDAVAVKCSPWATLLSIKLPGS
nr:RCC1 domain-containing protein 1-like isoform X2 [Rhipicephalus microplus]